MKTIRFITLTLLFVIAVNAISFSQNDKGTDKIKYNTWSATLSAGSMLAYCDLRQFDFYPVTIKNSKEWYQLDPGFSEYDRGFGLKISKQLSPIFGIQGMLEKGTVNGIKTSVDAHFSASFLTYGFNVKINILPIFNPNMKAPKIAFYGIAGIGLCNFKTIQTTISSNTLIHSYGYGDFGQEKKNTTETIVPIGLGIKYKINKHFDLGIEATMNNLNTDKFDARVKTGSAKDKYGYTALTLTYNIGKNEKSLEWSTPKDQESDNLDPLFNAINKKIDSLGNKLNELDSKVTQVQKDIADLKNPAKEADDDNDGVPNSKDLEPNTPAGNLVNFQGITIPKGGTSTSTSSTIEIKPVFSIFFTVNSTYIDALNEEKIAAAAKMMKDDPTLKFEIVGHADKTGGQVYNDLLSKRRAQAVYDDLVKSYGIDASRLSVDGKGISDPLSTNILSVNRRVDFMITK